MSKGSRNQTTTQRVEPYFGSTEGLHTILQGSQNLYDAGELAQQAGFTPDQLAAQQQVRTLANQPNVVDTASGALQGLLDPSQYNQGLEGVKREALSSAIPAATAQFSGAGLTDSTTAQQEVGRAATQAIAPIEYGAHQAAQNRALQAAGLAPGLEQAQYIGPQALALQGAQQQAQEQGRLDLPYQQLQQLSGLITPVAFGGASQSGTQQAPRPGFGQILGGALQAAPFLAALSDRKLKKNIRKIGKTSKGHNLYEFNYLWDNEPHVGVMADEVPHAIAGKIGPYSVVDYGKVM